MRLATRLTAKEIKESEEVHISKGERKIRIRKKKKKNNNKIVWNRRVVPAFTREECVLQSVNSCEEKLPAEYIFHAL